MGRPRKWADDAEKMRAYRARKKAEGVTVKGGKSKKRSTPLRPFVAFDGEDIDGHYCMLSASNGARAEATGRALTPEEFFAFCVDMHTRTPDGIFVGFASTYDFERGFLANLPVKDQEGIAETADKDDNSEVDWYRVRLGEWRVKVHYRPKMHLKLRVWEGPGLKEPIRITLTDTFKLFQRSFARVLTKEWPGLTSPEEMAMITEWKAKRATDFTEANRAAISDYNDLENVLLVRVMNAVRDATRAVGLPMPTSWHGPGPLVKAAYRQKGVIGHLATERPPGLLDAQLRAYFGGRFQCLHIGEFEHIYDYDLISAYPAAIWRLPSERGEWTRFRGDKPFADDDPWTLYRVNWNVPDSSAFGPFPFRHVKEHTLYPLEGKGWYWHWEVAAARKIFGDAIEILGGWRLQPETEDAWQWIMEQAEYRAQIKHEKKGEAQVLKLVNNSAYGVLIQSVGKARYQSVMLAGLITAWTRAKLLDAAALNPDAVIGFATDGVFSRAPLPVPIGTGLGEWEDASGEAGPGEIWANGIYCFRHADGSIIHPAKARGIPIGLIDWNDLRDRWRNGERPLQQTYTFRAPISVTEALHRGKPEIGGTWQDKTRTIDTRAHGWTLHFSPTGRGPHWCGDPQQLTARAIPMGSGRGLSEPYSRGLWAEMAKEIELTELDYIYDERLHDLW